MNLLFLYVFIDYFVYFYIYNVFNIFVRVIFFFNIFIYNKMEKYEVFIVNY